MVWIKPFLAVFVTFSLLLFKSGNKKNDKKSETNSNKTDDDSKDNSRAGGNKDYSIEKSRKEDKQ